MIRLPSIFLFLFAYSSDFFQEDETPPQVYPICPGE